MLISKTPLRISLFGGGTDYVDHFKNNSAGVLGGTVNKYIYTSAIYLSSISEQKFKISYREVENVAVVEHISHKVIREALKSFPKLTHLNICTNSDLPGSTGLGSSSSFTVGLIDLLHRIQGLDISREDLFESAVHLERNVLKETGGIQDQLFATYGGMYFYDLSKGSIIGNRLDLSKTNWNLLNNSISLVFTSQFRNSSVTATEQSNRNVAGLNEPILGDMHSITLEAFRVMNRQGEPLALETIGRLLTESWHLKCRLSESIENDAVTDIIEYGLDAGAFGAKLLGAGNGGFVLFLANKKTKQILKKKFQHNFIDDVQFQPHGSLIKEV